MRTFGLTPDQILARGTAADVKPAPSLPYSIGYGALSFAAVSLLAYSIWAFRLISGTAALYGTITLVYIGLTGVALSRLVMGPGATRRFALLFAVGFLAYAFAWCAFWFGLNGKHHADLWGSVVGLAAMTWLCQRAFGQRNDFLPMFAVLFSFYTMGYYAGESLYGAVRGPAGRLLWGGMHGLGFGAGLGYVLFRCQEPLKLQLRSAGAR